jgi:hypothetical protein
MIRDLVDTEPQIVRVDGVPKVIDNLFASRAWLTSPKALGFVNMGAYAVNLMDVNENLKINDRRAMWSSKVARQLNIKIFTDHPMVLPLKQRVNGVNIHDMASTRLLGYC